MHTVSTSGTRHAFPMKRFVWDLTYACPLRCVHCFTESGRRTADMLDRDAALRVADVIVSAAPERLSIGGGEPLLAPWWEEAARRVDSAGVPVTVFTSGWLMNEIIAERLAGSVTGVAVSVDGTSAGAHDVIRGRRGSFERSMASLGHLDRVKRARRSRGAPCYRIGIEYTVTRSGWDGLGDFVAAMTDRFPDLDYITFGAVIPEGLAQEEGFVARELLSDGQLRELGALEPYLASRARNGVEVSVTDVRQFLPTSPTSAEGETIAHIEASGQLRASTNYEAKVGSVLDTPLDELWSRALAWRADPYVAGLRNSVRSLEDWARVTRLLDRRYGSLTDRMRIARRSAA